MKNIKLYTIVLASTNDKSLLNYDKRQIVVKLRQTTNRSNDKSIKRQIDQTTNRSNDKSLIVDRCQLTFNKNNISIFERINLNFNRMTHEFRINTFFIEN